MKDLFFDPSKIPVPVAVTSNSASQVKTFETCERLWTLQNPHKLRPPVKPGGPLELGTMLHKQIELAVTQGIEPPSPLAYAAWRNLPAKGTGLVLVEKQLTRKDSKGEQVPALYTGAVAWKGSIDYVWQPLLTKEYLDLWDHKSTTNMSWAKISDDLVTDLQLNVYAKYAFTLNDSLKYVNVHHNYMVTSSMNETHVVSAKITREQNDETWKHIETRAHEMQVVSDMALQSEDPNFWQRAKPNRESCSAFGGCAFKKLCFNFDLKEVEEDLFDVVAVADAVAHPDRNENKMSAADLLKSKINTTKIAVDAAVAAKPATSMPPPAVASPAPAMNPLMAMMAAKAQAQATPTFQAPATTQVAPTPAASILPPDAPEQGPGIPAPPTMASPATEGEETAEAKETKRKRRTKAEMEAARAAEAQGNQPVATSVTVQSTPASAEVVRPKGFILCIGCMPVMTGEPSVSLEFVIANQLEKAAQQMNIANIHVLDYGKKASLLTELLKKYEFTSSCYTFTTNDNFLEGIIMATVSQKAMQVIRGVR